MYPNTMMKWGRFKELYPEGRVFIYPSKRWLDPVIKRFFALVLVHDATHDIVTLFSRIRGGVEVQFDTVDFRGRTDNGQLEQKSLHNAVYWMVWSHWFPETELLDGETQGRH